jgi:uncharacterized pyridoxamine 5'-phosphate oxidase family protein
VTGYDAPVTEPLIGRPTMPGYGIVDDIDGALSWKWAKDVIDAARNPAIATMRPDGRPHVMPVWAVWLDDQGVVFSTAITSIKSKNLLKNPNAAFYFERDRDNLVIEGRCEIVELTDLDGFVETYRKKYNYAIEEGPVWVLRPTAAFGFIETDEDFAKTATRWRFQI